MFDWLRSRVGGSLLHRERRPSPGVPAGELPSPDVSRAYADIQAAKEEAEREKTAKGIAEEELRIWREKEHQRAQAEAQAEYEGRVPPRAKTVEEILSQLPEKEREKYEKRIKEGKKAKVEAEMEIWEAGIPGKKRVMHRTWNPATQQHEFKEVEVSLSPQERLAEARIQKVGGLLIEEEVASLRQRRRERGVPYRLARGAAGFGQHMAAVSVLGIAGLARGMEPGRGGPQRAARMHAPGVPLEFYRVRPMLGVGMPSRSAVLPRRRG